MNKPVSLKFKKQKAGLYLSEDGRCKIERVDYGGGILFSLDPWQLSVDGEFIHDYPTLKEAKEEAAVALMMLGGQNG